MYELIFGYRHCFGKTVYGAGMADTREEAVQWVVEMECGEQKLPVPKSEPLRTCPVTSCPIRRQSPWFSFREGELAMPFDGRIGDSLIRKEIIPELRFADKGCAKR